jgi:hypothetical protein
MGAGAGVLGAAAAECWVLGFWDSDSAKDCGLESTLITTWSGEISMESYSSCCVACKDGGMEPDYVTRNRTD